MMLKIHLWGNPDEVAATARRMRELFEVLGESEDELDQIRGRVSHYLDVSLKTKYGQDALSLVQDWATLQQAQDAALQQAQDAALQQAQDAALQQAQDTPPCIRVRAVYSLISTPAISEVDQRRSQPGNQRKNGYRVVYWPSDGSVYGSEGGAAFRVK